MKRESWLDFWFVVLLLATGAMWGWFSGRMYERSIMQAAARAQP